MSRLLFSTAAFVAVAVALSSGCAGLASECEGIDGTCVAGRSLVFPY